MDKEVMTKVLYIVVVDDVKKSEEVDESFRYTRAVLQSTLQLMGCKARHAFKVIDFKGDYLFIFLWVQSLQLSNLCKILFSLVDQWQVGLLLSFWNLNSKKVLCYCFDRVYLKLVEGTWILMS